MTKTRWIAAALLAAAGAAKADVGDPQVRTDHPWYPGELAFSTFERLFATQAELYKKVVGIEPTSDQDKALASFLWRLAHYWHGEEGVEDLWGAGFEKGGDTWTREYWTGLFAHGFGLCGTTHAQWTAEMEKLLGHGRGRSFGCVGHSSFEVFLKGGPYGEGKWVLLDHDISTVIFGKDGGALLSIPEIQADLKNLANPDFMPGRQKGWPMCSYHKPAGSAYAEYASAGTHEGYAGAPPMVRLRRGETLRRYLAPGLEDGKTFVYWGRNYKTEGIPGPERWGSWVNQPEKIYPNKGGTGYKAGQARYANAVYVYRPDFRSGGYREGVADESERHVTIEFASPYIIAATPVNDAPWGIYDPGGRNGLVLRGKAACPVSVSVDRGRTWKEAGAFADGLDLTDLVKGHRQYRIRFGAGATSLADAGLTMRTVCQASVSVIPRLKDGGTRVSFESSGRSVVSAGPTREQARTQLVDGNFESPRLTIALAAPRKERAVALHAAAHALSYTEPNPRIAYQIEVSSDDGKTWTPLVKDWRIVRLGQGPKSGWSQSFVWGDGPVSGSGTILVRFSNSGNIAFKRAEAHLVTRGLPGDGTKVTFDWTDDAGPRRASHVFEAGTPAAWELPTGKGVVTRWVEYEPAGR